MNIFVLHENPVIAAQMHCDKHIPKMIIEHTQMLAATYYHTIGISRKKEISENQDIVNALFEGFPRKNSDGHVHPYGISHVNHPCTVWTRESRANWIWLLECTKELCNEFERRWKHKHSISKILDWMEQRIPFIPDIPITAFAQAMPICFKHIDAETAYRQYYAMKTGYMKIEWKYSQSPEWWTSDLIKNSIRTYEEFIQVSSN